VVHTIKEVNIKIFGGFTFCWDDINITVDFPIFIFNFNFKLRSSNTKKKELIYPNHKNSLRTTYIQNVRYERSEIPPYKKEIFYVFCESRFSFQFALSSTDGNIKLQEKKSPELIFEIFSFR